jgi:hypothetical protein
MVSAGGMEESLAYEWSAERQRNLTLQEINIAGPEPGLNPIPANPLYFPRFFTRFLPRSALPVGEIPLIVDRIGRRRPVAC